MGLALVSVNSVKITIKELKKYFIVKKANLIHLGRYRKSGKTV